MEVDMTHSFNSLFPGQPHLYQNIKLFWISLILQLEMMEVEVETTRTPCRIIAASFVSLPPAAYQLSLFYRLMSFLLPSQQCQNTAVVLFINITVS